MLPLACGSSAAHPGSLVNDSDGDVPFDSGYVPPPVDAPIDTAPVEAGPTTVSITGTVGGPTVTDIPFGDNGLVNCGSAATSQPVIITNTGNSSLSWTATLSAGASHFTLAPASGGVAPGQSMTMQIIPAAIPSASDVTADLYGGVVTIQTSASNDSTHVIQLHQTARGVILKSTLGTSFNFNSQAVSQTAQAPFSLTNSGNVPATISLAVGSAKFGIVPPAATPTMPFVIGPNGTGAPTITFSPDAVQSYTDTLVTTVLSPDGGTPAICAPTPAQVTLMGTGNNTVSISPTNLDFGLTDCGTTAPAKTVVLQNKGAAITFSIALAKGVNSPFVVSPLTGSVGSSGQVSILVTPQPIPKPSRTDANFFGDSMTITTNDGAPTQHTVTLTQTARGAVLQFAPVSITTHGTPGQSQFVAFNVNNVGNYQGTFLLGGGTPTSAVTQTTGGTGTWSSNVFGGNLVGGAGVTATLTVLNPVSQNLGHVTLTIQPNSNNQPTILCADAPPDLELSAAP